MNYSQQQRDQQRLKNYSNSIVRSNGLTAVCNYKNILAEAKINIAQENNFLTFREAEHAGINTSLLMLKIMQNINLLCGSQNNNEEIIAFSEMIKDNFRSMIKAEEMIYVFQQIANGKYGKIFGKLNYNQIAEMIGQYIDKRSDRIDQQEENRKIRELGDNNQREKTDREISTMANKLYQEILAKNTMPESDFRQT